MVFIVNIYAFYKKTNNFEYELMHKKYFRQRGNSTDEKG